MVPTEGVTGMPMALFPFAEDILEGLKTVWTLESELFITLQIGAT